MRSIFRKYLFKKMTFEQSPDDEKEFDKCLGEGNSRQKEEKV